jgi:hypothetical protein
MFYASCILDVLLVFLIFMFSCLYIIFITEYFNILLGVFDPCKDLLDVNKDEDGVVNFMPWLLYD